MLEKDIGYAMVRTTLFEDDTYKTEARLHGEAAWFFTGASGAINEKTAREQHDAACMALVAELGRVPDGQDTS